MQILIVEDDSGVSASLTKGLEEAGFNVDAVGSCAEAEKQLGQVHYDLTVLDRGLPDGDGLSILKKIRAGERHLPVVMLTARDGVEDRVEGLDIGADDYIVKPFAFAELHARIRALLRRAGTGDNLVVKIADLEIDVVKRSARRGECILDLRPREYDLLLYLARQAGHPVSREAITRDVWQVQSAAVPMDNVIDVHISHLREKLDKQSEQKLLKTVRGVGFMIEDPGA